MSASWRWDGVPRKDGGGRTLPTRRLDGLRILVVDDDQDARELLATVLEQRRAVVSTASNVADALDLLAREEVDVVVSDIAMPEEDGYMLIAKLRRLEGARGRVPAIAVTAHAAPSDRARAMEAGFDRYHAKPVDLDGLVDAIVELHGPRLRAV